MPGYFNRRPIRAIDAADRAAWWLAGVLIAKLAGRRLHPDPKEHLAAQTNEILMPISDKKGPALCRAFPRSH
jgi:hypothetical protein